MRLYGDVHLRGLLRGLSTGLLCLLCACNEPAPLPILFPDAGRPDVPIAAPVCGDGVVHPFEACDDGNSEPHDSCVRCQRPGTLFAQREFVDGFWKMLPLPSGFVVVHTDAGLAALGPALSMEPAMFWALPEGERYVASDSYESDIILLTADESNAHTLRRISTGGVELWRQEFPESWGSLQRWTVAARSGQSLAIVGDQRGVPHLWLASAANGRASFNTALGDEQYSGLWTAAAVGPTGFVAVGVNDSYSGELYVLNAQAVVQWRDTNSPRITELGFTSSNEVVAVGFYSGNISRGAQGVVRSFRLDGTMTSELLHRSNQASTEFRQADIADDGAVAIHARRDWFGYSRVLLLVRDGRVIREMQGPEDNSPGDIVFNEYGRVLALQRGVLGIYEW